MLEREAAGLQGRAALPKKEKRPPMQHQVGFKAAPVSRMRRFAARGTTT